MQKRGRTRCLWSVRIEVPTLELLEKCSDLDALLLTTWGETLGRLTPGTLSWYFLLVVFLVSQAELSSVSTAMFSLLESRCQSLCASYASKFQAFWNSNIFRFPCDRLDCLFAFVVCRFAFLIPFRVFQNRWISIFQNWIEKRYVCVFDTRAW